MIQTGISDEYEKAKPINQHCAYSERTVVQQIDVLIPPASGAVGILGAFQAELNLFRASEDAAFSCCLERFYCGW